jgi:hypothetical protein
VPFLPLSLLRIEKQKCRNLGPSQFGSSVEQIERFYAKHLPLSREMAKNLKREE